MTDSNTVHNPPAPPADSQAPQQQQGSYTPPDVEPGKLVGFPRSSAAGNKYINMFYTDENGVMHRLNVFENVSAKTGKKYYRGYGDKFVQDAPASAGDQELALASQEEA